MRLTSTSRSALFHRIIALFCVAIFFFTNSAVALANFSASILAFASVLSSTSATVRISPPENASAVSPASAAMIFWKASPHAVSGSVDSYRIYSKPSSETTYSACPAPTSEKNLNKNCSVEYSFSTDATENFSLTVVNLNPGNYDFLVRTVANVADADFDSSIHESKTNCASCEITDFPVTLEDETATVPVLTSITTTGGGGSSGISEPTHAAAPKVTVTKISETATEIIFSINLNSGQNTEAQLGISSFQKNETVDERLIEIGQLNENEVWKSFTKTEIKSGSTSVEVQKSGVVTAKIIDAEVLEELKKEKIETKKPVLPTIEGEIPIAVTLTSETEFVSVEISSDTKIQDSAGEIFNRVIHPPQVIAVPPNGGGGSGGGGVQIESAISVGSSSGSITFDQPVLISLPIENFQNPKLVFHDDFSGEWLLTEDTNTGKFGGKISPDGKTISAFVSHFTIFAVAGVAEDQLAEMEDKSKGWNPAVGKIFRDLAADHWSYDFVINLKNRGVLAGYPDSTFRPNSPINRAELTKIAVEAFLPAENSTDQSSKFPDVGAGSWFEKFVVTAENSKIVAGYPDGSFCPANFINRAEALKILIGAAGFATDSVESEFSDIASTDWFAPFVAWSEKKGVVGGYPLEFGKYEFPRSLQFGSNGEDVGVLQFLLREMGFYFGKTSFYFGNLTVGALVKFQEKNLVAENFRAGVLDEITKNKIYELTGINQSRLVYEFRPANPITRAEVAKIVSILLDLKNKGFSLDSQIHAPSSKEKPRFDLSKIEFENPLSISTPAKKPEVFTPNSLFEKLRKIF